MMRSSTLLQAAYTVCRFLIQERDLPTLLQGICDRIVGKETYDAALMVLLDQTSGGMITAETGLGEQVGPVMAELREGRLPQCGNRVLRSESNAAVLCTDDACRFCTPTGEAHPARSLCAPLRCSSSLSGFMIVRLPPGGDPHSEESGIIAELAEAVSQALRQLFVFEEIKFKEQELRLAEERYELALHASQAGLWDWNIKTGEMYTSPDQWELLDYRDDDGQANAPRSSIYPEDRERVLAVLNEHLTGATEEYRIEYRVREKDGTLSWFLDRGRVVERDANNMPVRMTGTHQNITLQKMQEQALEAVQQQLHDAVDIERNFLQTVIDSAGDPVMVIDLNFNLLLINQAAAQLVRGNGEIPQLQGQKCYHLFCAAEIPCHDLRFPCPVVEVQSRQRQVKLIHNPYHGNNVNNTFELEVSPLRNSQGELYGIIEVARDVTDRLRIEKELRDSQSHLYRLAHHDTLTGLPNRLLFRDRLTQAISKAERNRTGVAVLFLDLDHFKQINDTLGHDVGDDLLVEVAARLQRQCRQSDTVARLGGDEFVFVLEAVANRKDAAVVAEKIMAAVTEPISVKGHELHVTTSIGVALYPEDSTDLDGVIKCADIALYAAKEIGRSNFQMYRHDIAPNGQRPQMGADQFQEALATGGLLLQYLPQWDLKRGTLAGVKVLPQWEHPDMGLLLPNAFLAAADECGMLARVTQWYLEEVCRVLRSWHGQGLPDIPVTLALTSRQLRQVDFIPMLAQLLIDCAVAPGLLVFEVQEKAMADVGGLTAEMTTQLAELGTGLAIADFGANGCSISRLQHVPVQCLTISREWLSAIPGDRQSESLLLAVLALGRALGLTMLADGVENDDQLDFLRAQGCDLAQGLRFGEPLSEEKVAVLISELAHRAVDAAHPLW